MITLCVGEASADFNSQPREGGWPLCVCQPGFRKHHFNSQPREGGWLHIRRQPLVSLPFQLTAARRRLAFELHNHRHHL